MALDRVIIQDQLVAAIKAVSSVAAEQVFTDFEVATDLDDLIRRFRPTPSTPDDHNLQYWKITRIVSANRTAESTNRAEGIPIRHAVFWDHEFRVEFRMPLTTTNEAVFQGIIDDVLSGLQGKRSYGSWSARQPLWLEQITTEAWQAVVLCRLAVFRLTVTDPQYNITPS